MLGGLTEVLLFLRSVDLMEPDFGLPVSGIQDSDRIAIGDTHDLAGKVGLGCERQQQ